MSNKKVSEKDLEEVVEDFFGKTLEFFCQFSRPTSKFLLIFEQIWSKISTFSSYKSIFPVNLQFLTRAVQKFLLRVELKFCDQKFLNFQGFLKNL